MAKKFAGQEWANRDLNFVAVFLGLLVVGWVDVRALYCALAVPVLWLALYGLRQWRRARDRKRNPREFWADKVR
jgi:uncharacterized membrane protein YfcA